MWHTLFSFVFRDYICGWMYSYVSAFCSHAFVLFFIWLLVSDLVSWSPLNGSLFSNKLLNANPNAGKYWRQEEKGMTADEMVGWHHQLKGMSWVNSGSWWWTGRPGVLQSMGSQRIGHDLRDWTELNPKSGIFPDARITLVNRFNLCLMEFTNQWRKCWTNDERNEEHTLGGPVVIWNSGKTSGRSDSDQKHK